MDDLSTNLNTCNVGCLSGTMDDFSTNLNTCNVGCLSGTMMVNHLMYADDLVIFCTSAIGLRKLLEVCEQYSNNHAILYNHKKSAVMIYRNEFTRNVVAHLFKVNDSIIPEVSHVKYLDHFISNDGRDDLDIMRQRRQLYVQGNMLPTIMYIECCTNYPLSVVQVKCLSAIMFLTVHP